MTDESKAFDYILKRIRNQISLGDFSVTIHAHGEMVEEDISLSDLAEALQSGVLLENYPEHRRGPCCLILGFTRSKRPLHIVCTTAHPRAIIITVYEPKFPKWITPTERRPRS